MKILKRYGKIKNIVASILVGISLLNPICVNAEAVTANGTIAPVTTILELGWPESPATYSETAVVMNADTGEVVYNKGMDELRYPASITKLMTLLLAIENSKLDEVVTFTETGIRDVTPDSGNIGMQLGETMSMKSCLYAVIIQSANEVAAQVAEYIGGTEENFIKMMNEKAAEIGCKNTHFVNASGLPDPNHYSTAYDFALIMKEGLKNRTFRKFLSTPTYVIPATNKSGERRLHTHVPLIAEESALFYEGCLGGKTGYTSAALNTMVVAATRKGNTYIVTTMRNAELNANCQDTIALLNYAFENTPEATPKPTETPKPTKTPIPTETPIPEITEIFEESEIEDINLENKEEGLSKLSVILLGIMAGMIVLIIVLLIILVIKKKNKKRTRK